MPSKQFSALQDFLERKQMTVNEVVQAGLHTHLIYNKIKHDILSPKQLESIKTKLKEAGKMSDADIEELVLDLQHAMQEKEETPDDVKFLNIQIQFLKEKLESVEKQLKESKKREETYLSIIEKQNE